MLPFTNGRGHFALELSEQQNCFCSLSQCLHILSTGGSSLTSRWVFKAITDRLFRTEVTPFLRPWFGSSCRCTQHFNWAELYSHQESENYLSSCWKIEVDVGNAEMQNYCPFGKQPNFSDVACLEQPLDRQLSKRLC